MSVSEEERPRNGRRGASGGASVPQDLPPTTSGLGCGDALERPTSSRRSKPPPTPRPADDRPACGATDPLPPTSEGGLHSAPPRGGRIGRGGLSKKVVPPLCQQPQLELFTSPAPKPRPAPSVPPKPGPNGTAPKPARKKHAKGPEFVYPGVALPDDPARVGPFELPIAAGRGQNNREHWTAALRRKTKEREAVRRVLVGQPFKPETPCRVVLTRIGPSNGLDDDNLAGSLKSVRDEVALWLGVDDRKREVVRYVYEQRREKVWRVTIAFQPMENP